jgi:hypothetical protein
MPTATGGETIDERLTRLRTELSRVRNSISRGLDNGTAYQIGGVAMTEIRAEWKERREKQLEAEIRTLEARKAGSRSGLRSAQTITRMN